MAAVMGATYPREAAVWSEEELDWLRIGAALSDAGLAALLHEEIFAGSIPLEKHPSVHPLSGGSRYSITVSARSCTDCGIVRPSTPAVFMLITRLNFVGRSIGSSPGLAPLRILST